MKHHMLLVGFAVSLLSACSGEVTRGDLYQACVEGEMRLYDTQMEMVRKLGESEGTGIDEAYWNKQRRSKTLETEKSCACSADSLPTRMAADRLDEVLAFYKANGTMRAKAKFDNLTIAEQTELVRCGAEQALEKMRRDGLLD